MHVPSSTVDDHAVVHHITLSCRQMQLYGGCTNQIDAGQVEYRPSYAVLYQHTTARLKFCPLEAVLPTPTKTHPLEQCATDWQRVSA